MRLFSMHLRRDRVTVAITTVLGVGLIGLVAPTAAPAEPGADRAADSTLVRYHGVRFRVPDAWPVIDLADRPDTCARVDRHAVYLGTARATASCPPGIHGRTETITLRPLGSALQPGARVLHTGTPSAMPRRTAHAASWALEAAGLTLTVTYGTDPGSLDDILAGMRLTHAAHAAAAPRATESASKATQVPGTVKGHGFDTCQAPSAATMDKWRSSFKAIGVYIGGGDLGCPNQPHLSASWVHRQKGKGWHILPIYVGRQAPCSNEPFRISKPSSQGKKDANDAVSRAAHYGMAKHSILINDMEYYPRGGSCSTKVLSYLSAWTKQLHARGYRSGVYSSRAAAIAELINARSKDKYQMPGTIFFADWDGHATVKDSNIPSYYWVSHHRIKQYHGAHNEKHGGVKLNIDSDYFDVA